ncbi:T9SS type A sorting domain-containing protein [Fulvivirga sp. RKSG066]|uniref:S8 family serine peptidase n=1 Tax=Fulvivirga aurantia TaxID=2529383 RepID=UPI0012BB5A69|nr:S8 family serine peptidase [Fulvivirga aurantia]MTI22542.1 T9SS type A sorting domain-containing protein [Fulvivirga aurantia]
MVRTKFTILLLTILPLVGFAQGNRYMVFFSDKESSAYSTSNPEEFLSSKAIERRVKQEIAITEQDLPVNDGYLQGVKDLGIDVFFTSKWFNAALIQTEPANITSVEALSYVDSVLFVAPGERLTASSRKHKDKSNREKSVANQTQLNILGINSLHSEGYFGEGISMAFLDGGFSGVNTASAFQHIFDENRVTYVYNFVENSDEVYKSSSHGTQAFSTVAALIAEEYQGIATGAEFMLFTTEDVSGEYRIEEYNWLIATEKADSAGVDIISTSLGYNTFDDSAMDYTIEDLDGKTAIISQAAEIATLKGILVVTSAGNEGSNEWQFITTPADADNILAVGSVGADGEPSGFSSIGPTADGRIKPDVVAYGGGASVINSNGSIGSKNGTSFSAPQVAGLAALSWQANPTLTNLELRQLILELSVTYNEPNNKTGYGIPDYKTTLSINPIAKKEAIKVFPNPLSGDQLNIKMTNQERLLSIEIFDINGRSMFKNNLNEASYDVLTIDLEESLKGGVYVLELITDTQHYKARLVKF